jgi:predicted RNA-binding Zn ribbon-like protein
MQFNTYTVAGAHIAVWLVNHPAPSAPDLAAVLDSYDVHQPVTNAAQIRALRPWVRRLRDLFEAATVAEKAERADALLIAADCRPRLVHHWPSQPYHFHYAPVASGLAARVKALTAAGLAHVIDDGGGLRLRTCTRAGCGTAFLDVSRNGRRHFCSVRCANQVNVARHRQRRRQAGAGDRPLLGNSGAYAERF